MHLDGVGERIRVPFLVAHGANDRQIPLEYARLSYDQAVNSPKRGAADLPHVSAFIADWVAETFAETVPRT